MNEGFKASDEYEVSSEALAKHIRESGHLRQSLEFARQAANDPKGYLQNREYWEKQASRYEALLQQQSKQEQE